MSHPDRPRPTDVETFATKLIPAACDIARPFAQTGPSVQDLMSKFRDTYHTINKMMHQDAATGHWFYASNTSPAVYMATLVEHMVAEGELLVTPLVSTLLVRRQEQEDPPPAMVGRDAQSMLSVTTWDFGWTDRDWLQSLGEALMLDRNRLSQQAFYRAMRPDVQIIPAADVEGWVKAIDSAYQDYQAQIVGPLLLKSIKQ